MGRFGEIIIVFGIGAFSYGGIEILFRGYTHFSMFVLGGLIFLILYKFFNYVGSMHLIPKCILGCTIITTLEFITGVVLNLMLGLNVWNYTEKALNLYGQICPAFSIGWFLLCIPVSLIVDKIRGKFNQT